MSYPDVFMDFAIVMTGLMAGLYLGSSEAMLEQRQAFGTKWRTYHWARTCVTGVALLLSLVERVT